MRQNALRLIKTCILIFALVCLFLSPSISQATYQQSLTENNQRPVPSQTLPSFSARTNPIDSSPARVIQNSRTVSPGPGEVRYQIVSQADSQSQAAQKEPSCGQIWGAPPISTIIPDWLDTPTSADQLSTDEAYLYLAGKLLQNGLATAPKCSYNGLLPSGLASQCGMESIRPQVKDWQNQFDQRILQAAGKYSIPARLLKNIFAQESQFWLGESSDQVHFGVGHITEGGLDPLFLAYPDYYKQICQNVLSGETCQKSYADLSSQSRGMIRGYFLQTVIDVSCKDCPKKFDEQKASQTIDLFARLLVANCQQVNRVIVDITEKQPGLLSSYDDLWRYTMINYNAGSGCVSGAIEPTFNAGEQLDWLHVSARLQSHCKNAREYVDKVSK